MHQGDRLQHHLQTGWIDPGSKRIHIGLGDRGLFEAMEYLIRDEESMCIALHELTHFYSLQNPIGVYLWALTMAEAEAARSVVRAARGRGDDIGRHVDTYQRVRERRVITTALWRPMLEGLATFVEMVAPCAEQGHRGAHLRTLHEYALTLQRLLGSGELGRRVLEAGHTALSNGPSLGAIRVGWDRWGRASQLEMDPHPGLLPYSLGHAYIRRLHRIASVAHDWQSCPEVFLETMLRLVQTGWRSWVPQPGKPWAPRRVVHELYRWATPFEMYAERIEQILERSPMENAWSYLQTGQTGSARLDQDTMMSFIRGHGLDRIILDVGDSQAAADMLRRLLLQPFFVNLTESCPAELQCEPGRTELRTSDGAVIDVLLSDRTRRSPLLQGARGSIGVLVSSFAYRARADDPADSDGREVEQFLFQLMHEDRPGDRLLLVAMEREPRWALEPTDERTSEIFAQAENWRRAVERTSLDDIRSGLTAELQADGYASLGDRLSVAETRLSTRVHHLRDMITDTILTELLGRTRATSFKNEYLEHRLSRLIGDWSRIPYAIEKCYGIRAQFRGPGIDELQIIAAYINERAIAQLGHPLFDVRPDGTIAYQGLWGAPFGH